MFCGKCGARNSDDAVFCESCGSPVKAASPAAGAGDGAVLMNDTSGKTNRKVGIIAVAIVAVILAIILISLFSGRSYKSTVNKYIKATFSADGKTMISLVPDDVIKTACEEEDMSKRELTEEITETLKYSLDYIAGYYDDWSYTYKITDVEDYSDEDLEYLKEDYEDDYDTKVKAAKTVTVELTVKYDEDDEYSTDMYVYVIKVGRSWYIDVSNML